MDVSYLEGERFLWAQLRGTWLVSGFSAVAAELRKECQARKTKLLLVDLSPLVSGRIPTIERFVVGLEAASLSPQVARLAAVLRPDQIDPDRFGERVARNRGLDTRVFTDLKEARTWLLDRKRR